MSDNTGQSGDVTGALYVTLLVIKAHTAIKEHITSLDRPVVQSLLDILRLVVTILEDRRDALAAVDHDPAPVLRTPVDRYRWN